MRHYAASVATLEDKIVQRAVAEVLNAVYEADFRGFSYGFRPGRGPHHALDALAAGIYREEGELGAGRGYQRLLRQPGSGLAREVPPAPDRGRAGPAADPKWLNAGVIEDGKRSETTGFAAGGIGFAVARQRVPALCLRPVGRWWRKRHAHAVT